MIGCSDLTLVVETRSVWDDPYEIIELKNTTLIISEENWQHLFECGVQLRS